MELNKPYYAWLELQEDGEYLIPMSDPMEYEYPFDYLFDSEKAALQGLIDFANFGPEDTIPKNWVLTQVKYSSAIPLSNISLNDLININ